MLAGPKLGLRCSYRNSYPILRFSTFLNRWQGGDGAFF